MTWQIKDIIQQNDLHGELMPFYSVRYSNTKNPNETYEFTISQEIKDLCYPNQKSKPRNDRKFKEE